METILTFWICQCKGVGCLYAGFDSFSIASSIGNFKPGKQAFLYASMNFTWMDQILKNIKSEFVFFLGLSKSLS